MVVWSLFSALYFYSNLLSEVVSPIVAHKGARYSGLPSSVVVHIVEDLTYGNRGIKNPDPALQPLIPIAKNKYALAPWFWLSSDVERNFTVLMNRLPEEQKIYAQLVNEKENTMRAQIMDDLMENGLKRQMMIVFQHSMLNTLSEGRL